MKMKTIIQFILLVLFFNVGNSFAEDLGEIAGALDIKRPELFAVSGSMSVLVSEGDVPLIYTVYIVETDTEGNILRKYVEKKEYDDPIIKVAIDTADYRLNADTSAFAVRITMERASRIFGSTKEILNLFDYKGEFLRKVLDEFVVYETSKRERFGDCEGAWDESKTILIISNKKTNGYYNITTKTRGELHGYNGTDEETGECNEIVTPIKSSETLKFDGKKYNMSK